MMRRRDFLGVLGGAAVTPLAARAQQPARPVIGFFDSRSPDALTDRLRGFRQGLRDNGYVEGENVAVEYRWAENQPDRLPALAASLVHRQVTVIVSSGGLPPVLAAKAATTTIPILFLSADDPVQRGLVASLARPGGNLTGINFFNNELGPKQLGLLRELVPTTAYVAVLVNPVNATTTEVAKDVESAARSLGLQIQIVNASTRREIDAAFATFALQRPDALFVPGDPFFNARRVQLTLLAFRLGVPAIYSGREYADAGGLMSYGSDIADAYRQLGVYAGRVLKGEKPAAMPVTQATKFELVINAQTARMLGVTVPPTLLARADEVIE
jgi:putative ABC transport system substrate-binding protein